MNNVLRFPFEAKRETHIDSRVDVIERHLSNYQWHFGRDAYWHYVTKNCDLPDPSTAQGLCKLLGRKVKANDNKYYYPNKTELGPKPSKATKVAKHKQLQLLSTIEVLVYDLATTQVSPKDIAEELIVNKSEHIANHVDIALSWLADFTASWNSHDKELKKFVAAENPRIHIIK